jgi:hypothetical protein
MEPVVRQAKVIDRCAEIALGIAARYAPLDSPPAARLMIAIDDLAFNDPQPFDKHRLLLRLTLGYRVIALWRPCRPLPAPLFGPLPRREPASSPASP